MWNIRNCITDSCVYVGKIENWLGVLCTVSDIWLGGEPTWSGYVSDETRIVFRSSSSQVLVFIQLGREMQVEMSVLLIKLILGGTLIKEAICTLRNVTVDFFPNFSKNGAANLVLIMFQLLFFLVGTTNLNWSQKK